MAEGRENLDRRVSRVWGVFGTEPLGVGVGIDVGMELEVVGVGGVLGKGLEEDDDMIEGERGRGGLGFFFVFFRVEGRNVREG